MIQTDFIIQPTFSGRITQQLFFHSWYNFGATPQTRALDNASVLSCGGNTLALRIIALRSISTGNTLALRIITYEKSSSWYTRQDAHPSTAELARDPWNAVEWIHWGSVLISINPTLQRRCPGIIITKEESSSRITRQDGHSNTAELARDPWNAEERSHWDRSLISINPTLQRRCPGIISTKEERALWVVRQEIHPSTAKLARDSWNA